MADLLKTGAAWLQGVFDSHGAVDLVVYDAEGSNLQITDAVFGDTIATVDGAESRDRTKNRDFLIKASWFTGAPADGKTLSYTEGFTKYTYTIVDPFGTGPWEWHDAYHQTYRIHAVLSKTESA